jgi:hypothetical protein
MQKFEKPYDVPLKSILDDIDHLFMLFNHIEWLQFVGGEIFMHKEMATVYEHVLKYIDKFDKLILMTNATIVPRIEEVAALKKYGDKCKVMISDYGKYSYKLNETQMIYETHGIPYVIKSYHGDMQYYGGWIDNTSFDEYQGSNVELNDMITACPQIGMRNMHCLNGKLHMCSNSCFMTELGVSRPDYRDFVDLNDDKISLECKREIIQGFYNKPVAACRICSFRNANTAVRYPAAEQVQKKSNFCEDRRNL